MRFTLGSGGILSVLCLLLTGHGSLAQESAEVWQGMTQQELDATYDQAVYAANLEQVLARQAHNSELAREHLGPPQHFQYGESDIESLNVYKAAGSVNPMLVYVHGGTWRFGVAADNAFAAETFVNAGIDFVVLDFASVDAFAGDLEAVVAQLERALVWLQRNAAQAFAGDPKRMYLAGFSSGAHLAAVLLTRDWQAAGLADYPIAGALLCSGMYEMLPVSLSFRREFVNLTEESIPALSPQRHVNAIAAPVLLAYGSLESPEFMRQAEEFSTALTAAAIENQLIVGAGYNHFEMIETLGNPYGVLGRAMLDLIESQ